MTEYIVLFTFLMFVTVRSMAPKIYTEPLKIKNPRWSAVFAQQGHTTGDL